MNSEQSFNPFGNYFLQGFTGRASLQNINDDPTGLIFVKTCFDKLEMFY